MNLYHASLLSIRSEFTADAAQKEEEFVFSDILERPVPSLLRGFSAPIRLESDLSDSDLFFLLAHDSDEFSRFVYL
jgi:aminopeptidase N